MKYSLQILILLAICFAISSASQVANGQNDYVFLNKDGSQHQRKLSEYQLRAIEETKKKQEEKNAAAAAIHEATPQGSMEYEEAIKANLYLRIQNMNTGDVSPMKLQNVYVNNLAVVFIVKTENDIREVASSASMSELISPEEDLEDGRCCDNLSPLDEAKTLTVSGGQSMKMHCFHINDTFEYWTLCSNDFATVYRFRQQIQAATINVNAQIKGLPSPDMIFDNSKYLLNDNWVWEDQTSWSGECQQGRHQSPISFEDKVTLPIESNLKFNYYDTQMSLRFNGYQTVVEGEFGNFEHQKGDINLIFAANKIAFKFPQEHYINDQKYDGEMQIYHTSADGSEAVVSIFLKNGGQLTKVSNFFDAISGPMDTTQKNSYKLSKSSGLNQLLPKGTLTTYFNKSFYLYKGSHSTPPCNEGVLHFIMKNPVEVNASYLKHLQERNVDTKKNPMGNARSVQKHTDIILSWTDTYDYNCPDELPESIAQRVQDELNSKNGVQATKPAEDAKPKYKGKFLKTTADIDTLIYSKPDDAIRKALDGEASVDPKELSNEVKHKLLNGASVSGFFKDAKAGDKATEGEAPAEAEAAAEAPAAAFRRRHHKRKMIRK